jgi:hypothetical protein
MVLTTGQQRNLFSMLETGTGSNQNFSMELRGDNLIAVQRNTMNRRKKVNYRYD